MTIANRKVIEILQAEGLEKGWDLIKGISKPLSYAEKRREEKTEAARKEKEDFLLSASFVSNAQQTPEYREFVKAKEDAVQRSILEEQYAAVRADREARTAARKAHRAEIKDGVLEMATAVFGGAVMVLWGLIITLVL